MLTLKFLLRALIFILVVFLADMHDAKADHYDPFVQVTCSPELDYFSIRTFHIEDSSDWPGPDQIKVEETMKNQGIYNLEKFINSDYHCQLSNRDISFQLIHYNPPYMGRCDEQNAKISMQINQKPIYTFDTYSDPCHGATHDSSGSDHQIEYHILLNEYGDLSSMKDCRYQDDARADIPTSAICESIPLPDMMGNNQFNHDSYARRVR